MARGWLEKSGSLPCLSADALVGRQQALTMPKKTAGHTPTATSPRRALAAAKRLDDLSAENLKLKEQLALLQKQNNIDKSDE